MARRVPAPAEHYLITQGESLVTQFGGETLSKFAVDKLLEAKMTSRNFKAGLDFSDHYKAQRARNALSKMFHRFIEKELAFLFNPGVTTTPFIIEHWARNGQYVITTIYDKAISRYCRRVEREMARTGIPLRFTLSEHNYEMDKMEITFHPTNNNDSSLNYYRLMFHLDKAVKVYRSLAKKAAFSDVNTKALNRSKHSGYFSTEQAQRNAELAAAATQTPVPAGNTRRTRRNLASDAGSHQ